MRNLIIIILLLPTFIFSQNKKEEKKATNSAIIWLEQIDNGSYLASWDNAGEYFQNQIQQDRWSATLNASRLPLGQTLNRKINSINYKTELPGVPDGNYYIISFDVSYKKKNKATETTTLLKEKDGFWKVVGYFIK